MPAVGFSLTLTATNYTRVRRAIEKMTQWIWYRGIIKDTAHDVLEEWAKYASSIIHKETGDLSRSIEWEYDSHTAKGRVYINPNIGHIRGRRGRTVQYPRVYGVYEHARGGHHAFFARTLAERGHLAETAGMRSLIRNIPEA